MCASWYGKLLIGLGINETPQILAEHAMRDWLSSLFLTICRTGQIFLLFVSFKVNFVMLYLCERHYWIPPCIDTKLDFLRFDLGHPLALAMQYVFPLYGRKSLLLPVKKKRKKWKWISVYCYQMTFNKIQDNLFIKWKYDVHTMYIKCMNEKIEMYERKNSQLNCLM